MTALNSVILGATAMAGVVASLFFYRFWRHTRDRFFLFFAVSFLMAALERVVLGVSRVPADREPLLYLMRLVTHALIIVAIIDKNRGARS